MVADVVVCLRVDVTLIVLMNRFSLVVNRSLVSVVASVELLARHLVILFWQILDLVLLSVTLTERVSSLQEVNARGLHIVLVR